MMGIQRRYRICIGLNPCSSPKQMCASLKLENVLDIKHQGEYIDMSRRPENTRKTESSLMIQSTLYMMDTIGVVFKPRLVSRRCRSIILINVECFL